MSLQDLLRGHPKPGQNNMKAQAPELLISTVDRTGQTQGTTRQGHTLDEDVKVEQGQDELDHGGLSVDEAPIMNPTKLLNNTASGDYLQLESLGLV